MPVLVDCYVLVNFRSKILVDSFLSHFLPHHKRLSQVGKRCAADYEVPQYSPLSNRVFKSAAELFSHLEEHPNEGDALYWENEESGEPRMGMVFPTIDGQLVFGLSCNYEDDGLPNRLLERMKTFLNSSNGYVTYEESPPRTAQDFISNVYAGTGLEKNSYFYYCLGRESLRADKWNDAISHFERSLSIDPHCRTYERLAFIMDQLGRNDLAFESLRKAFDLNPRNDLVSVRFAETLLRRGDLDQGKELLQQVLARNSTYGPAKRLLSEFA
jgi:tetratricopeptide (TPR) repeat protein